MVRGRYEVINHPTFYYDGTTEPLANAFIYFDLPETPADYPIFEIEWAFKTNADGVVEIIDSPDDPVYVMMGEWYNVYYSYWEIQDFSNITEMMCQCLKAEPEMYLKSLKGPIYVPRADGETNKRYVNLLQQEVLVNLHQ